MKRRTFVAGIGAATLASFTGSAFSQSQSSRSAASTAGESFGAAGLMRASSPGTLKGEMLYRKLGKTGEDVSAIGLGGAHLSKPNVTEQDAIRLVQQALDRGMNFMDNCWDYSEGMSEERMGKALAQGGYRQKAFLMTKVDGRSKDLAMRQLETSLQRLKTDHIDLLQHHEVLRFDDPDRIFAEGGAMEAFLNAKKQGKIRYIGFTGHKDPRVHLYMLQTAQKHGFHFDTLLMPLNVMDAHFRSFAHMVVPEAMKQGVGILSMKSVGGGDGIILKANTGVTAVDCIHYAMNLPTSVVIAGIDKQQILDQAFQAAKSFKLMDEQQVASLLQKTREVAMAGKFELFKTTSHFDGTAKHPDWLGGDTPAVQQLAPQPAG